MRRITKNEGLENLFHFNDKSGHKIEVESGSTHVKFQYRSRQYHSKFSTLPNFVYVLDLCSNLCKISWSKILFVFHSLKV